MSIDDLVYETHAQLATYITFKTGALSLERKPRTSTQQEHLTPFRRAKASFIHDNQNVFPDELELAFDIFMLQWYDKVTSTLRNL